MLECVFVSFALSSNRPPAYSDLKKFSHRFYYNILNLYDNFSVEVERKKEKKEGNIIRFLY